MKLNRLFVTLLLSSLGVAASLAQEFTQADLEKMVAELDAVSTHNAKYLYPIKCSVVDKPDVNAYASIDKYEEGKTPQAVMVVFKGLVKFTNGDRRIIRAVVAHEVSHLMLGHVLTPVFVAKDLRHLWTRQQEMAADAQGAILLQKAGYDKKDMIDMLFKLDEEESEASWMWKLAKNDHTSAKNRAAEVAGNTDVMRSMMSFEKGMAYWECRSYQTAARLFEKAYKQEPKLTDALINAAQVSLMDYYDNLPLAVQDKWFRPDFGPMLTDSRGGGRGVDVSPEDIARYKLAMDRLSTAGLKLPGNKRVQELALLAGVLAPEATNEALIKSAAKLAEMAGSAKEFEKLRLANNAAIGYHRAGDSQKAYEVILAAQKTTDAFNSFLGQNLGRFNVPDRSKEDESLVAAVLVTWLKNSPSSNTYFTMVKERYLKACEKIGAKAEDVQPEPTYLCTAVSLFYGGKEAGLFVDSDDFTGAFGSPAAKLKIDDLYPDVQFWSWSDGGLSALTERGQIVRVTATTPGSYIDLKASNPTVTKSFRISVGMTATAFGDVLDLSKSVEQKVVGSNGKLETWNFFPALLLGVRVADGKIAGITVAPTHVDE